ncbi:SDR family oxidoreductase [Methylobacterium organophilum]|uniref:SDR family oxidoreductase n=1 Tax=Methylobacterium organophilum TaxID=410 RepID=UPI001F133341|nr:SDR family oxidoreductase [Methylobacterium organophilum]UMY15639.1 SDR family oxidoreductase [Methylobacterium organophilum]
MTRGRTGSVVVTGGTAGVGRAVAEAFARRGWNVAVIARGEKGLHGTVRAIERLGGRALAFCADVADADAMRQAADETAEVFGGIDVWVNNAMLTVYAEVRDMGPEEFARVTEVTYLGQVHGTQAALRHMLPAKRGTIVYIGSALAYRSIPLQSAYCAAKAAVRGFVDSLRTELLHEGSAVRLTMVQLPAVNTPQFDWARSRLPRKLEPVPPIFQPEAVAEQIIRAAFEAPRELWIGGASWKAILGNMIAPGLIDRYLATHGFRGEMTSEEAMKQRPDNLYEPVDTDPGAHGRFDDRSANRVAAADPRWLKLGLAAVLGLVGGATLFATRAEGRGLSRGAGGASPRPSPRARNGRA